MASSAANMPFIKNLASSDRKLRTQSVESLKAFLSTKYSAANDSEALTFEDAQKLWAGLFYALWMADRAPVQQRLCDELAELPEAVGLSDASTASWLRGFWATMARQWTTGIDVLRMNKFMLLVRRVFAAQLRWMTLKEPSSTKPQAEDQKEDQKENRRTKRKNAQEKNAQTKESSRTASTTPASDLGLQILAEWPLNPSAEAPLETGDDNSDSDSDGDDRPSKRRRRAEAPTLHVPVGLSIHVVDIWVDELDKLGLVGAAGDGDDGDDDGSLRRQIFTMVKALAAKSGAPAVRKRALESLEDERLPENAAADTAGAAGGAGGGLEADGSDNDDEDMADDASWDGFND